MTEETNIYLKRVKSWEGTNLIGSWTQTFFKKLLLIGGSSFYNVVFVSAV